MPIKSYLAYPRPGCRDELVQALAAIPCCEVLPADNRDVIILVTDTPGESAEERLAATLNTIPSLQCLALVAGRPDGDLNQIQPAETKPL